MGILKEPQGTPERLGADCEKRCSNAWLFCFLFTSLFSEPATAGVAEEEEAGSDGDSYSNVPLPLICHQGNCLSLSHGWASPAPRCELALICVATVIYFILGY